MELSLSPSPQLDLQGCRVTDDSVVIAVAQLASVGNTMIQLYRLGSMPVPKVLQYLDAAAAQGIYVHLDVCELVSKIVGHNPGQPGANSTAVWRQLKTIVLAARRHPALLAWYIADDTVNWPHEPLKQVYHSIKLWDPYHPASIAMAWAGTNFNTNTKTFWNFRLKMQKEWRITPEE